jgi:membrane protein
VVGGAVAVHHTVAQPVHGGNATGSVRTGARTAVCGIPPAGILSAVTSTRSPAPVDGRVARTRSAARLRDRIGRSFPRSDLALWAAGLTLFGVLGIVPAALGSIRLAAVLIGADAVSSGMDAVVAGLPGEHGVPDALRTLTATALGMAWWQVLTVLFLASMYGEGLRRAFRQLAPVGTERLTGWRGRLGLVPVLLVAPLLLLALLLAAPWVAPLYAGGGSGLVLGVVLAFYVVGAVVSVALLAVYRFVPASGPVGGRALLTASFGTGAFVSGFLQGFLLFLAIPVDWSAPFGGLPVFGAVTVLTLWLYLLHLVLLAGYRVLLVLDRRDAP